MRESDDRPVFCLRYGSNPKWRRIGRTAPQAALSFAWSEANILRQTVTLGREISGGSHVLVRKFKPGDLLD